MNLYKLSQDENNGYDTYDSVIVCAENEEKASKIHPGGNKKWKEKYYDEWCLKPENVTVELVGVAGKSIKKGVILSSFNAG